VPVVSRFSNLSEQRLSTCDERLQRILREAIKQVDLTVICGHRTRDEQDDAFRRGASTKRWPLSKHNRLPSLAVDIAPYPVDWKDTARFARLAGYIERIAHEQGVPIRWGGDWDQDGRTTDERLIDMPHLELVE
jgi:peptidoglycan L-alanyl-D-glutamate endopeptidase CwlK